MFLQGGFNVCPVEVENVLAAHPGVALAAGIGIPDDVLGEGGVDFVCPRGPDTPPSPEGAAGMYFVAPRDPDTPPSAEELTAWCRERLADYKVPRRIDLRGELPTTPAGKIAKAQLRGEVVGS